MAMRNCNWNKLAWLSILFPLAVFAATKGQVQYDASDFSLSPTGMLASNFLFGGSITGYQTNKGRMYLTAPASISLQDATNAALGVTETATNQLSISDSNLYITKVEATNLVSEHAYGQIWYVWGSSNTVATNALGTPYRAMLRSDSPIPATANTNVYTSPAPGTYIGEVVSAAPAGITSLAPGDIFTLSYAFLSAAQSVTVQPEIYIRTNLIAPSWSDLGEREIAVGNTVTINGTTPSAISVMVPLTTNVVLSATNYIVRKLKVTARTGTPNVSVISQGAYPSRVTLPIGSASFVLRSGDTMGGNLVSTQGYRFADFLDLTNVITALSGPPGGRRCDDRPTQCRQ